MYKYLTFYKKTFIFMYLIKKLRNMMYLIKKMKYDISNQERAKHNMKKMFTIIKASMSENMNVFRISTKKKNFITKYILPIILALIIMSAIFSYSEQFINNLISLKMEIALLTMGVFFISIMTFMEGIYKSEHLLFNCKDDNLLFSLPIKRSTVLFARIFKFYIFEVLFNSMFLIPVMLCYAIHTRPAFLFYIVSLIGLLVFPIVPIVFSCIIGMIISAISSNFKRNNIIQTIITIAFILGIMYCSYNSENLILKFANRASNYNDFIKKIYYPAGIYIELVTKFDLLKLLELILINIAILIISVWTLGKKYFAINSNTKSIRISKSNNKYSLKSSSPIKAIMKKEFSRFINSSVFVVNAGFSLILFIVGCIMISLKSESIINILSQTGIMIENNKINTLIPIMLFCFICATSFLTSITSSMISLEGKTINLLKSLPITPYNIIKAKVLTAIAIMLPFILIGDTIIFLNFKFDMISIVLILIASIVFPAVAELLGIIINLKYPKMDAKNDTEVIKQSMSSAISVMLGMALIGITVFSIFKLFNTSILNYYIMIIFLSIYVVFYFILNIILHRICDKCFENIDI